MRIKDWGPIMSARKCGSAIAIIQFLIAPANLHADGGDRQGFFASLGIGGGVAHYSRTFTDFRFPDLETEESKSATGAGVATDLKLGTGLSPTTWLYFVSRSSRIDDHGSGLMALGVASFMTPTAPSLYVVGMFGIAQWFDHAPTTPFQAIFSGNEGTGIGVGAGLGYEFLRHLSLEATVIYAQPNDVQANREAKNTVASFLVTIQATAY